jgi:hypothetical protein
LNGKYHDGNKSGNLCFKIRKNEDLDDFEVKRSNLLKKISDEMGLSLKKTELNTRRPV